jgi:[acyl-carrier-protein] S-malonyltransferase
MLEPFRHACQFPTYYARVCELLGYDPLSEAASHPEILNCNAVSSLLTVLASVLALELLSETVPAFQPLAAAGYSVGQWTALHAAGALSVEDLLLVVYERACRMDACVKAAEPSGMLALIGLRASDILELCAEATTLGLTLQITNDNAPGQITLGGTERSLRFAEERLRPMSPKRLHRVPAAGAWHSKLLEDAVPQLADFLKGIVLCPLRIPVIDNTTGDWLPEAGGPLRAVLARHVASPVLWRQGIQTLAAFGVSHFLEVGYGDLLTKYGFFIDRSLRHVASAPPPRGPS